MSLQLSVVSDSRLYVDFFLVCPMLSCEICVSLSTLKKQTWNQLWLSYWCFPALFYWLCGLIFFGFSLDPHAFDACFELSFWSLVYIYRYTYKALEMFDLTQLFYGILFLNVFNISMILLLLFLYFSISWIHYKQFDHFASPKSLCCS